MWHTLLLTFHWPELDIQTDKTRCKESFILGRTSDQLKSRVGVCSLINKKGRIDVGGQLGIFATRMGLGFFISICQIRAHFPQRPVYTI